jgi:hypothetical protein
MKAPFHLILIVLAMLLFLLAGLGDFLAGGPWAWTYRLIAWGLFCWALSEIVTT